MGFARGGLTIRKNSTVETFHKAGNKRGGGICKHLVLGGIRSVNLVERKRLSMGGVLVFRVRC